MLRLLCAIMCFAATLASGWSIPDTEVNALCEFYTKTNGENWRTSTGWAGKASEVKVDPCTWYGVTCKNGRVNAISLSMNSLSGVIPESFGDMTEMISFDFGVNRLTGTFPKTLTRLTKLYAISIRENNLRGTLDFSKFRK